MRYLIYGAGGIGGVVGGRLFAAGYETVLICRGNHLEAIRAHGLTLREPGGDRALQIPAVGHPRELQLRDSDVVILTMKTQDTLGALDDLEAAGGGNLPIVCCQNGVDNERMAARRFARVYAMLVSLPATFMDPGVVIGWGTPSAGVLDVGCYPDGVDGLISTVAADVTAAGFVCRPDPAVMRLKYTKLLSNLNNGFQAVTELGREDDNSRAIMRQVRQEALDCYAAAGIDSASQEEYQERVGQHFHWGEVPGAARAGNSTWQSLAKGSSRLETDFLNGEIVLLGRLHGVPTPYNAALRSLSQQLAAQGGQPGACTAADVEALARRLAATTAVV